MLHATDELDVNALVVGCAFGGSYLFVSKVRIQDWLFTQILSWFRHPIYFKFTATIAYYLLWADKKVTQKIKKWCLIN